MAGLSTTKEKDSGLWLGKPISDLIFSSTSFSRIELTDEQDIQHIDGYNYSLTTQRPFGQKNRAASPANHLVSFACWFLGG